MRIPRGGSRIPKGKVAIPMGKVALPRRLPMAEGWVVVPAPWLKAPALAPPGARGASRVYFFTLVTMRKWRYSSVFTPSPASRKPSS